MADCDEPECEFDTDKPLLPKWIAWTWPIHWSWWVIWGAGVFTLGYGLMSIVLVSDSSYWNVFLPAIGSFIMGWCHPNPFGEMMKGFTFGSDPEKWTSEPLPPLPDGWHLERKSWSDDSEEWLPNPVSRYEQDKPDVRLEGEGDEWVVYCDEEEPERFSSPKEADDYMVRQIKGGERIDAQELLFGDHPRHNRYRALYNATPPQFTARFIFHTFSVLFFIGGYLSIPKSDESGMSREMLGYLPLSLMVIGAVSVIVSHFSYRTSVEAWDTVTSIIKYADGGHGELVGQIRPITNYPPPILNIDGCKAADWTFHDLIAWAWAYTCTETWKERYYDSSSKTWKTRTRTETRTIRTGNHVSDFMIHDGTGGMSVKLTTFERVGMGSEIWTRNRRGDNTCGPYDHARHGGSLKHKWYLNALRLGDPAYVMARIKSRPHDEVPRGMVGHNATRIHHTLEAVGEDAPRRRAKVAKGNEFSVLSAKSSATSRLGPLLSLVLGCFAMMLL
ncbi:MAG: hypothetical protein VX473_05260 [Candidatus Thermoplasmatota archaeon]|nr:hypothetical protein [Candidatus Thermoplasmatota archaeon]